MSWLLLFFSFFTHAAYLQENWTSVRALGMGNAYSAVVNDGDSLFYNPAGLAAVTGFHFTIADPHVGYGGSDAINSLKDLNGSSNTSSIINKLYGKPIWLGGGAKSVFYIPYFAVGGFTSADISAGVHNPAYTEINLNYFGDYGLTAGVGFDIIPAIWHVGVAGRRVNRTGNNLTVGAGELATLKSETLTAKLKNRGNGYGVDLGSQITVPTPFIKPTVSFVWRNAGQTAFSWDEGLAAPPPIKDEMLAGAAVELAVPPFFSITPSIDYKYITRTEEQIGKKLHLGIEATILMLAVRAGLNQGYYTLGAGVDLGLLRVDAATYGVELGEYPGQLEDRRYVVQATLQFGFGGGSSSVGGSGSGKSGSSSSAPRVKRRR